MATKRIVAANMRRALEIVREQLGEDAIILSTQRHPDGVELIATREASGRVPEEQRAYTDQPQNNHEAAAPLASDNAWQFQDTLEKLVRETPRSEQPEGLQKAVDIERARKKLADRQPPIARARKTSAPVPTNIFGEPVSQRFSQDIDPVAGELGAPGDLWASQMTRTPVTPTSKRVSPERSGNQRPQPAEARPASDLTQDRVADMQIRTLQDELAAMRALLDERLGGTGRNPHSANQPVRDRLSRLGLPEFLCERLVAGIDTDRGLAQAWPDALALLSQRLPVAGRDWVAEGGIFALEGPTGVGKTTTIAKLAVRYALARGIDQIALVSTDRYRLAGHEQLNALASILGVSVHLPGPGQSLAQLVAGLTAKSLILIDTAGLRPGDDRLAVQQRALNEVSGLKRLLVLAANSQVQSMKACLHAYGQTPAPDGLILTKLDECASLGESLGLFMQKRIPLVYTTDGQEIPRDISLAKGHRLVAAAAQKLAERSVAGGAGAQQLRREQL